MKTLPISNINMQNYKAQTFKGIWGETHHNSYLLDSNSWIYEYRETKDFYPLLDESKQEIDRIVKQNTKSTGGLAEGCDQQSVEVAVKDALNFTKREWIRYKSGLLKHSHNRQDRLLARMIEDTLIRFKLMKYMR